MYAKEIFYFMVEGNTQGIKVSARVKDAVRKLKERGQDPTFVVQAAINEALKDGRGKVGAFGRARQHVDLLTATARLRTERDNHVDAGRRFGDNRKEKRHIKRAKHKEDKREQRKGQQSKSRHDFY